MSNTVHKLLNEAEKVLAKGGVRNFKVALEKITEAIHWVSLYVDSSNRAGIAAIRTLRHLNYTYTPGAELWKPPLGTRLNAPNPVPYEDSAWPFDPASYSPRSSRDRMWHCADGRRLRVRDMTDEHVINAARMLRRKGYMHSQDAANLLAYASDPHTPDGAATCAENEFDGCRVNARADAIFEEVIERNLNHRL